MIGSNIQVGVHNAQHSVSSETVIDNAQPNLPHMTNSLLLKGPIIYNLTHRGTSSKSSAIKRASNLILR